MRLGELEEVVYRDVPAVLVLADSDEGLRRSAAAVEGAGYRVSNRIGLPHDVERLNRQACSDAIFVDVSEDHGERLDLLLDTLERAALETGQRSVINGPISLIDRISSRVTQKDIWHLCAPEEGEIVEALKSACAPPPQRLNEIDKGDNPLQQLSEEVVRISEMLSRLSGEAAASEFPAKGTAKEQPVTAASIRALIRARRSREQFFPAGMFADPAWDMLLDLMAARLEGQRVAVSSLCIAAAVPPTTALRWIKTLTDHEYFVRVADPHDGRRVFIELSDDAAERVMACLRGIERPGRFSGGQY